MIFVLFYIAYSHYIFDFREDRPANMILFFDSYDSIDVIVLNDTLTLLSKWNNIKDLYLEVELTNDKNRVYNYGPFDKESRLSGIYFSLANYTLKFAYKKQGNISIALKFWNQKYSSTMNYRYAEYSSDFEFSDYNIDDYLLSNFTYEDKPLGEFNRFYMVILVLLGIDILISLIWSSMCCRCCQKNKKD